MNPHVPSSLSDSQDLIYGLFLVYNFFSSNHIQSQALIKQDLISVQIDSTSATESRSDSKVEELMLSSTAFLYLSWTSSFRNFQVRLFGGGLCYFLICVLKIISHTSTLCWVTHSSFPITFTFWTCFRSLWLTILSSERNQDAVGFWKLSFSLLQPFFKYYHSNATWKAHIFSTQSCRFLQILGFSWKKIKRSVFV